MECEMPSKKLSVRELIPDHFAVQARERKSLFLTPDIFQPDRITDPYSIKIHSNY